VEVVTNCVGVVLLRVDASTYRELLALLSVE
jgi:hypothetical protein